MAPALYIKLLSCHSTGGRLQWQAPASVTRQPEAVYLLELVRAAGAPRQRVVARVLEDGLRHLPPPLDGAVQALVPGNNVVVSTGCSYKLSRRNLMWGPLKCSKSNFNPVHVFLHFNSFCLVVLKLILASKLSELEQFENRAANYQLASIKGGNEAKKTNQCN